MLLRQISEPKLAQYAYLVGCQRTGEALIIDPQRDIDRYLDIAAAEGLRLAAVAETHIHADFLSGARELAERTGATLYLSDEGDGNWKYEWALAGDYDLHLLHDGDTFEIGNIELRAVHTPGHTPEHLSFVITDRGSGATEPLAIATGDFVFVGDLGRPDLLETAAGVVGEREPSARTLFRSLDRFLELPDYLQVWPGHGAGSACGKALGAVPWSTVGYEKRFNASLDAARGGEQAFVDAILDGQPEPPLYFATMKRLNKEGPPVLGELPKPSRLDADGLIAASEREDTVVIDTRLDREAFMTSHLRGSLYARFDRSFSAIVGSYVRPEQKIVLLIDEGQLDENGIDEAVRDLVRIGFDHVVGFAPSSILGDPALENHFDSLDVADFGQLEAHRRDAGAVVLDVRGAGEYARGHVPGSLHIAHTRLLDRLDEVPTDGTVWVHCQSGARATASAALLERSGRRVKLVFDAFPKWTERAA